MEVLHTNTNGSQRRPVVLCVLDGLGVAHPNDGNAVTKANTPNLDALWPRYPHTYLYASENYVGLPSGVTGNSEVGHMALGAGSVIFQEIAKIDHEIESGAFFSNKIFLEAINNAKKNNTRLHLIGLVSNGKVHSSLDHLYACIEYCRKEGLKGDRVVIHAFTDGRDTPPQKAEEFIAILESRMGAMKTGVIGSVVGRYFAMDRDNRWERTQKAYDAIVHGKGTKVKTATEAIQLSYGNSITDEFIEPHVIVKNDAPIGLVKNGDSIIYFNYRADRAVQLSKVFEDKEFLHWERNLPENLYFAGFSNYQKGIVMNRASEDIEDAGSESKMVEKLFQEELKKEEVGFPLKQIFPPSKVEYSLGRIISDAGRSQLRLAESEKYPHVTYFFSCRYKNPFNREERIEIPSPKDVATYDLKPEMSSYEITDTLIKSLDEGKFDFTVVNFANTDMVAHTGKIAPSIRAVEVADECMGKLVNKVLEKGGEIIITADHGNIEEMLDLQTGGIDTKHSTNPVPFLFVANSAPQGIELPIGMLADIAPTVLSALYIDVPKNMTGRNLITW